MTTESSAPTNDLSTATSTSGSTGSQIHPLPAPFHNSVPPPQLLTQGAEALVYKTIFVSANAPAALKFRPSKPYRHPTLDARLTKQRVLAEARVLVKLSGLRSQGISVPAVLSLEWDVGRKVRGLGDEVRKEARKGHGVGAGAWILMEWIEGKTVKELLRAWDTWFKDVGEGQSQAIKLAAEEDVKRLLRRIGRAVAVMHSVGGVVHGDLTSSNIMVRPASGGNDGDKDVLRESDVTARPPSLDGEIVLIDFGLATQTVQEEDRAVDLYVLERAFGSTHPRQEDWFDREVLQSQDGYKGVFKGAKNILKRLEDVRMRGRKRTMVG